jgi:hypothetical protein
MRDCTKPSEYIRRHLSGIGTGFELDDMLSLHDRDPAWQDVLRRVHDINRDHILPGQPPLGVYKDEARADLERFAEELELQGR